MIRPHFEKMYAAYIKLVKGDSYDASRKYLDIEKMNKKELLNFISTDERYLHCYKKFIVENIVNIKNRLYL